MRVDDVRRRSRVVVASGRTGFVFPGQGTQAVGMGRWLARAWPEARAVFERADAALRFDLSDLCFRGPASSLTATENAQPAVLAVSLATWAVLRRHGVEPSVVAGHSVGELAALVAADSLDVEDALVAARRRGELMASIREEGSMASVLGLTKDELAAVCVATQDAGRVVVALVNAPDNCVLSGDRVAVDRAGELARQQGATRVTPLATSHAFHSPLMAPAVPGWREHVEQMHVRPPAIPLALNVSGELARSADDVRNALVAQLTTPVRWDRVCDTLAAHADVAVELGASRAVSAMVRRCRPDLPVRTSHDPRSLQRIIEETARVAS